MGNRHPGMSPVNRKVAEVVVQKTRAQSQEERFNEFEHEVEKLKALCKINTKELKFVKKELTAMHQLLRDIMKGDESGKKEK